MPKQTLLVISARLDQSAREAVAAGRWPRKDFFELERALEADVIDYATVESRLTWRWMRKVFGMAATQAWIAFRRRHAYRAILTDGEHIGIPLALLLKMVRASTAHVTIGHRLSSAKKRRIFRWLRPHTHIQKIALHSSRQYELAMRDLGIPAWHLALMPYQVDTDFWRPQPATEERLICSAGLEYRDYPTLFQAVEGLDARVVIGAASNWSRRSNSAAGSERPSNVEVGSFDYLALRELYARASIVVVPLDDVDFQAGVTTILEAMAMGKAIVVTHSQGQTDVVEDRRRTTRGSIPRDRPISLLRSIAEQAHMDFDPNGFYVPPGDAAALRQAIAYLLDNSEARAQLGAAGRTAVERFMNLDQFTLRLCQLVEDACATREQASRARPVVGRVAARPSLEPKWVGSERAARGDVP